MALPMAASSKVRTVSPAELVRIDRSAGAVAGEVVEDATAAACARSGLGCALSMAKRLPRTTKAICLTDISVFGDCVARAARHNRPGFGGLGAGDVQIDIGWRA